MFNFKCSTLRSIVSLTHWASTGGNKMYKPLGYTIERIYFQHSPFLREMKFFALHFKVNNFKRRSRYYSGIMYYYKGGNVVIIAIHTWFMGCFFYYPLVCPSASFTSLSRLAFLIYTSIEIKPFVGVLIMLKYIMQCKAMFLPRLLYLTQSI